ncbi:hypothetical protein O3P69_000615 [Scylla paramamosain]|uniref:Uncharacterized protein n=1 Tax=Scylla paramamosain TaxID=85552 RepID=A0AAW0UQB3_SCYPA
MRGWLRGRRGALGGGGTSWRVAGASRETEGLAVVWRGKLGGGRASWGLVLLRVTAAIWMSGSSSAGKPSVREAEDCGSLLIKSLQGKSRKRKAGEAPAKSELTGKSGAVRLPPAPEVSPSFCLRRPGNLR